MKLQLAELISSLADAKMQIAEVQEQLIIVEKRNNELIEQINLKENLWFDKAYYWKTIDGKTDGPYCQVCYDSQMKLIRLQDGKNDVWRCFSCKGNFHGKDYVRPQVRSRKKINHINIYE